MYYLTNMDSWYLKKLTYENLYQYFDHIENFPQIVSNICIDVALHLQELSLSDLKRLSLSFVNICQTFLEERTMDGFGFKNLSRLKRCKIIFSLYFWKILYQTVFDALMGGGTPLMGNFI